MYKKYTVFILCCLISILGAAQSSKKGENTISISTSLNVYPTIKSFSISADYTTTRDDILLNFITSNSGTFVVEEGEQIAVARRNENEFPTQLIGVGMGVRIQNAQSVFQEISLTKLGFSKSRHLINYTLRRMDESTYSYVQGFEQKSGVIGLRYEVGKLFGRKKSPLRFGLSGGLESTYYFYNYTTLEERRYPIEARVFNIHVSAIPMLTAKLSKKMFLDIKVISNFLLGENTNIRENFPFVPLESQEGSRNYNVPEIDWTFSVQFRFNLNEPKKRRRR